MLDIIFLGNLSRAVDHLPDGEWPIAKAGFGCHALGRGTISKSLWKNGLGGDVWGERTTFRFGLPRKSISRLIPSFPGILHDGYLLPPFFPGSENAKIGICGLQGTCARA